MLHGVGCDNLITRPLLTNQQPVMKLLVKVINKVPILDHPLDMFLELN